MVNFRSLPDAPITVQNLHQHISEALYMFFKQDEPFNPFWQPRYPAADFIDWTVKTVKEEARENEILGLNSARAKFYGEFPSYRHKIHAASLDFDALFIDSSSGDSDSDHSSRLRVSRALRPFPSSPVCIPSKSPAFDASNNPSRSTRSDVESSNHPKKPPLFNVSVDKAVFWNSRTSLSRYRKLCGTPKILRSHSSLSEKSSPSHALSGIDVPSMDCVTYVSDEESSPQATVSGHPSTLDAPMSGCPPYDAEISNDPQLQLLYPEYIAELEDSLYGPYYGPCNIDSVGDLIYDLDNLLPGIRLKKNLDLLYAGVGNRITFQTLLDYLSQLGQISSASLDLFRALDDVTTLDLRESLSVCALVAPVSDTKEVLAVLSHPNSFPHLTELILNNVPLHDEDLLNLCRLSSLDTLNISNTCIGDEAIAYLLPLKSTLAYLNISSNPRLTDDSCTLLTFLTSLSFLDIRQTAVNMPGLRRFARSVNPLPWSITIEVPDTCIEYLSGMQHQYAIKLPAPLITRPDESKRLTIEALRSNLVVHAQCNSNISTGGSKMEMAQRLEDILCRREDDLWVLDVLGWRDAFEEELELDGGKQLLPDGKKIKLTGMA